MLILHGLTMMFKLCWFTLIEPHLTLKGLACGLLAWFSLAAVVYWILEEVPARADDASFDSEGFQEWNL